MPFIYDKVIGMPLFSILFPAACLLSATPLKHPQPDHFPAYSLTHYIDENGLPQNSIKNINRDSQGFIWLANEAGLVRYDGKRFQVFSKKEMGTRYARIYTTGRWFPGGELFAVTEGNEEVCLSLNGYKPIFIPRPAFLSDSSLQNRLGRPTILTSIWRAASLNFPVEKQVLIPLSTDSFFVLQRSPHYYTVTLADLQKEHWRLRIHGQKQIASMSFFCYNRALYLYTEKGLFFRVTSSGIVPELWIHDFKQLIWNKGEQQTFILTRGNAVYLLSENGEGKLRADPIFNQLPEHFYIASALYLPEEEILLLGSLTQGLLVCKKKHFRSRYADLPDMQSVFYGIYPFALNKFISAKGYLLESGNRITPLPAGPDSKKTFAVSVAKNRNGFFFINSRHTVSVYTPEGKLQRNIAFPERLRGISSDADGNIWVASNDSGLYFISEEFTSPKRIKLPPRVKPNFIKEAVNGFLFIGSNTGLYIYNKREDAVYQYPHTGKYYIRSIFLSSNDRIYLCTYGDGIVALEKNGLIPLPIDRNGSLRIAHCMLQDKNGRLWISTNQGLLCVPENDVIRYLEKKERYIYYYFGKENGFGSNEFNGGCQPCAIRMPSDEMIFPSMNGLVFFNPDSVVFNFPEKELQINHISVNDTSIGKISDTLSVTRDFKRIEISLTTPLFDPDQNHFVEYTLDSNQVDAWAPVSLSLPLTFTSIPSGYSRLTFRQKRGFGSHYSYRTLVLYKPKAFWEWPAFWPLSVACIAIILFTYLHIRTRYLNERNRQLSEAIETGRMELMATIHSLIETSGQLERKNRFQQWLISSVVHDLRGPLHFIRFYGHIRKDDETATREKFNFLKSVYFSAQKIYAYSENLIQLLRIEQNSDFPAEKTDFLRLVENKKEQFEEQLKWNGVTLVLLSQSERYIYVNTTALSIIIQNLLDNSIKNVREGHVYISLENIGENSVIRIRDEGTGLSPELLDRFNRPEMKELMGEGHSSGVGLWLVHSLVTHTGGSIRFVNGQPSGGLEVTLSWLRSDPA